MVPKNIVICCDGTGNEIKADLSNVLKLFRVLKKTEPQLVYYDPGIGTLSSSDGWSRLKQKTRLVFGLATGQGLDNNILDAYRFLIDNYQEGDQIYLFGFSRGAYTIRALGGLLNLIGLLEPQQENLCGYGLTAYKKAAEQDDFEIAWRFQRITSARRVPIKFMGVWDTVSSVLVPRPDRLYIPSLQKLPYTARNPMVEVFRHAIAIDERRRMFRLNRWSQPQEYKPNPFDKSGDPAPQNIKQVWFAGFHSDVGGGHPEEQSGLAKFPLKWMLDEAKEHGMLINTAMYNHLVLGKERKGGNRAYVEPDSKAQTHDSMTGLWPLLEWLPKSVKHREWSKRNSFAGFYLPQCEPRCIDEGALIHCSVLERRENVAAYDPENLPPNFDIEG